MSGSIGVGRGWESSRGMGWDGGRGEARYTGRVAGVSIGLRGGV